MPVNTPNMTAWLQYCSQNIGKAPNLIVNKTGDAAPEILLYDSIGPDWAGLIGASTVAKALKEIGDVPEITVRVNSPGGSVFEGMAIYQQFKTHKAKINFEIDALAASIMSVIVMSGDRVRIAENAMMMTHRPLAAFFGNEDDLDKMKTVLVKVKQAIIGTYAARTAGKTSAEEIEQLMIAETWFTASEALERGLADEIVGNKQVTAYVDPEIYDYKHVPEKFQRPEARGQRPVEEPKAGRSVSLAERELDLMERDLPTADR